tara:strand:- start:1580 stop:2650 length:1071 start_codon:yes stop_codon:yes gene_type:complete
MNDYLTDDVRIKEIEEVVSPKNVIDEIPISAVVSKLVVNTRENIRKIMHGQDDRLLLIVGPCSIHDPMAAMDYANRLLEERNKFQDDLEIIMRVYFEKPRTTVGWKGLINDPDLNNSYNINKGLKLGRKLLYDINSIAMPAGVEFLDVISPQYVADLVSWGAIGARTTESQVHRELASGLSCPVGFKNGTSGNVGVAVDAVKASGQPHHFLSVTKTGQSAIVKTTGNDDCHVILRGGKNPNYDVDTVHGLANQLDQKNLPAKVMIDASHGNSNKQPENQHLVCNSLCERISSGDESVLGVMIESNIIGGRQDLGNITDMSKLEYGKSITDACISWDETEKILHNLSKSVKDRRLGL